MRILLVKCFRPFETGPSDQIASELVRNIQEAGHSCELVRIPETDPDNLEQLMRTLEIENTDRLASLDEASRSVRHPAKIVVKLFPGSGDNSAETLWSGQPGVIRVLLPAKPEDSNSSAQVSGGKVGFYSNVRELARWIVG